MKKREEEIKKGAPAYMNTYGDMMTLVLTFFVLLFSMSTIDAQKLAALAASFTASVSIFEGGQTIVPDTSVLENGIANFPQEQIQIVIQSVLKEQEEVIEAEGDIQEYIEEKEIEDKVSVGSSGETIIIRFEDVVLFDSGKADIKAVAIPTLSIMGEKIKEYLDKGYHLRVEGHTDNVPIQTFQFPSNWELSSSRAIAVMRFYLEEMQFDPTQLSAEGMGEYHPVASNDTSEGRAQNRRVEIKLSKPS